MSGKSKIEWTDKVWNPVTGCSPVSVGCDNCYAERMAKRMVAMGQPKYENGFKVTEHSEELDRPYHWKKPKKVFVCSMGDLFHDQISFDFIATVFGVMAANQHLTFQVLTKRSERMAEWFQWIARIKGDMLWPLPNVWLGVTAEDQEQADKRIPLLLQCPAAVRFVSCEPLLGPTMFDMTGIDWVIAGCESGPNRRPAKTDWFRGLRYDCLVAGVPFFLKQMEGAGKIEKMPELDGKTWAQFPRGSQ